VNELFFPGAAVYLPPGGEQTGYSVFRTVHAVFRPLMQLFWEALLLCCTIQCHSSNLEEGVSS
jgi:hypothetical protein